MTVWCTLWHPVPQRNAGSSHPTFTPSTSQLFFLFREGFALPEWLFLALGLFFVLFSGLRSHLFQATHYSSSCTMPQTYNNSSRYTSVLSHTYTWICQSGRKQGCLWAAADLAGAVSVPQRPFLALLQTSHLPGVDCMTRATSQACAPPKGADLGSLHFSL